jgi:hypothetical protein
VIPKQFVIYDLSYEDELVRQGTALLDAQPAATVRIDHMQKMKVVGIRNCLSPANSGSGI